jgi:urea transport system substrate-binding protein
MTGLRLGMLFPTSGDYEVFGPDCRDGATIAIEDLRGACSIAIFVDRAVSTGRYIERAQKMLQEDGRRHVLAQ